MATYLELKFVVNIKKNCESKYVVLNVVFDSI